MAEEKNMKNILVGKINNPNTKERPQLPPRKATKKQLGLSRARSEPAVPTGGMSPVNPRFLKDSMILPPTMPGTLGAVGSDLWGQPPGPIDAPASKSPTGSKARLIKDSVMLPPPGWDEEEGGEMKKDPSRPSPRQKAFTLTAGFADENATASEIENNNLARANLMLNNVFTKPREDDKSPIQEFENQKSDNSTRSLGRPRRKKSKTPRLKFNPKKHFFAEKKTTFLKFD